MSLRSKYLEQRVELICFRIFTILIQISFFRMANYLPNCSYNILWCMETDRRRSSRKLRGGSRSKRGFWDMELVLHSSGDHDSSPSKRRKDLEHKGFQVRNLEYGVRLISYECRIFIHWYEAQYYIGKYIIENKVSVTDNEVALRLLYTVVNVLEVLNRSKLKLDKRSCSVKRRRIEAAAPRIRVEEPSKTTGWNSLPSDVQLNILQRGEFEDLSRFGTLSKSWKVLIESEDFVKLREATSDSREGSFTAINYYIKNKTWRCTGFDLKSKTWRSFPPFSPTLPAPDVELFKEYFLCGHGSLMLADVAKLPKKGELVVFNPLTRTTFALPSLIYPRSAVLVHMLVDYRAKSFKVIVAGSSTAGDESLSKKVEIFDSNTSKWEETLDLPGPAFGLNEHQAGVCVNGVLYLIVFLEGHCGKGVVAFDVEKRKWLNKKVCPIPFSLYSNALQLVESDGKVYLFSEQEQGTYVDHCIDVLEISSIKTGPAKKKYHWRNVVRVRKSGGRGLQVYPEHICVPFGERKLCVFNTLNRDGVVYDLQDGKQVDVLQPPPADQKGDNFFSLNPASFTLQPSFASDSILQSVQVA